MKIYFRGSCIFLSLLPTVQSLYAMPETLVCSKSACNRILPPYNPNVKNFSTCEHCREQNRLSTQASRKRKRGEDQAGNRPAPNPPEPTQRENGNNYHRANAMDESDIDGDDSENGRRVVS
jgi:hypothetical protein